MCSYCAGEPEPGWIEMPDNGPIVSCPICNTTTDRQREYDAALAQRAAQQEGQ